MQLSPQDASLFFKLMPTLQVFGNQQLQIIKRLNTIDDYQNISNEKRVKLRNAFYEKPEIIQHFVNENPFGFSSEELEIISGWKNFIVDNFFLDRILKKHAIFIAEKKVYGVLALSQPFRQILDGTPLPTYIKTVLLPFKGKIIYDGLVERHNIFFGGGIATSMSITYQAAKQQGKIIESLDPNWQPPTPKLTIQKNWKPVLGEFSEKASKLRAGSGDKVTLSPTFSLIRASIEFAQATLENPDDSDEIEKAMMKVQRAFEKLQDTFYFSKVEF